MKYNIYLNEKLVNTIVADEEFCKHYCDKTSYTYKLVEEPITTEEPINEVEQLRADIDYLSIMMGVEL